MQIVYAGAEWLASIADAIIYVYYLTSMFGMKKKEKIITAQTMIAVILVTFIAQFLQNCLSLQIFAAFIILAGYSFLCLNGKLIYHLFHTSVILIATACVSMMFLLLASILLGVHTGELAAMGGHTGRIMMVLLVKMVTFVFAFAIANTFGNGVRLKGFEWLLLFILIGITLIISLILLNIVITVNLSALNKIEMLSCSALLVAITIISFLIISHMNKQNEFEQENKALSIKINEQRNAVVRVNKAYDNVRKVKHDLNRQLSGLLVLLKQNRCEEAITHIEEIVSQVVSINSVYVKENDIINSVLNEKMEQCVSKKIHLVPEVSAVIEKNRELDIAVMLSNLLDNAIEAEEKLTEGRREIV